MISPWRLRNRETGETVVDNLEVADGFWSRFKGLQLRASLPDGCGLLLVPCPSVHTLLLRFAIDVILIDRTGRVLAVRRHVRPWRVVLPVKGAYATLELAAGTARLEPGSVLRLQAPPGTDSRPPSSLAFLWKNE